MEVRLAHFDRFRMFAIRSLLEANQTSRQSQNGANDPLRTWRSLPASLSANGAKFGIGCELDHNRRPGRIVVCGVYRKWSDGDGT
jgi:hypothetical protein